MLCYRLYFFDRESGHIDQFREFEAEDDGYALVIAERWSDGCATELWSGQRLLRRWDRPLADND